MKKLVYPISFFLVLFCLASECGKEDPITYPETGDYGDNVLRESVIEVAVNPNPNPDEAWHYSFCADLPEGTSLKVIVKDSEGMYWFGSVTGWFAGSWRNGVQTFTADGPDHCDLELTFAGSSSAEIEIYENGSEDPTRVKTIAW